MRVAEGARDGGGTGGEYGRCWWWCDVVGNPWAYSHGTGGPKNTPVTNTKCIPSYPTSIYPILYTSILSKYPILSYEYPILSHPTTVVFRPTVRLVLTCDGLEHCSKFPQPLGWGFWMHN